MDQNQEEKKIRTLFQRLKAEDERNASSFARNWNAAQAGMDKPRQRWAVWQISTGVAALLILLGTGSWIMFRRSAELQARIDIVRSNTLAPDADPPVSSSTVPLISDEPQPETALKVVSPLRRGIRKRPNIDRRRSVKSQPMGMLISQWRSPTESLLETPGRQLFKRVPRLDESVVNIKATVSSQKN